LHLVAGFDEPAGGAELHVEIVVVRLRTKLDLLDLHHGLLALRLACALLLLVLELAEVEDLADGRCGLRVHLDQVEPPLFRLAQRLLRAHHAEHPAVFEHDPDFGYANAVVYSDLRCSRVAEIPSVGRHASGATCLSADPVGSAEAFGAARPPGCAL